MMQKDMLLALELGAAGGRPAATGGGSERDC